MRHKETIYRRIQSETLLNWEQVLTEGSELELSKILPMNLPLGIGKSERLPLSWPESCCHENLMQERARNKSEHITEHNTLCIELWLAVIKHTLAQLLSLELTKQEVFSTILGCSNIIVYQEQTNVSNYMHVRNTFKELISEVKNNLPDSLHQRHQKPKRGIYLSCKSWKRSWKMYLDLLWI